MPEIESYTPLWGVWEIVRQLGSGSYGDVYEAKRAEAGRGYAAAIKHIPIPAKGVSLRSLIDDGLASDEASARLYCRSLLEALKVEIDICYELKGHTNLVSYEDHMIAERTGGIGYDIFIRMELLTSLPEYISKNGVTVGEISKLCEDMCTALAVLERRRIIHRDIKPANIFVSGTGDFKLGDFGVARHMEGTGSMSVKGTYNYMAPELLKGGAAGPNSDLYSLGLVLYRLLNCNRAPFLPPPPSQISHQADQAALDRRLSGAPLPPPLKAELSPALTNVIMRACEYNPARRYQTADEMKRSLSDFRRVQSPPAYAAGVSGLDIDATVAVERNAAVPAGVTPPGTGGPAPGGFPEGIGYPSGGYRAGAGSMAGAVAEQKKRPMNKALTAALISVMGVIIIMLAVIVLLILPDGKAPGDGEPALTEALETLTPMPAATRPPATPEPVVHTESDLYPVKEPKHIYYGRWNYIASDPGFNYTSSFVVGGKTMRHGIGMYISSSDIREGGGFDTLAYSLAGRYTTLSFWLGSDSDWSHYEDSGYFRLTITCDDQPYFDSGYRDYGYYEYVELPVEGVSYMEIELEEIMGATHTLNIVLGEFTLTGK